jgi:hypothetical protein
MGFFENAKTLEVLHEYFYWHTWKEICKEFVIDA